MARVRLSRDNSGLLLWVRAVLFGSVTAVALFATGFFPPTVSALAALTVGALAAYSGPLASVLLVAVCALPVLAADFVAGVLFLLIGFGATQYLGDRHAYGFIVIALTAVAVTVHAQWAVIVLAGYLLGSARGALAATVSCLMIEIAGILLGHPTFGAVIVGGTPPGVVSFTNLPTDALSFVWLRESFSQIDSLRVISALSGAKDVAVLGAQAILWGAAAAAAGLVRKPDRPRRLVALAGVPGIVVILAGLSAITVTFASVDVSFNTIATATIVSVLLTFIATAITEWVFPLKSAKAPKSLHGVRVEDADVDELLSTIATAEEALASRHTVHAVVLITDVKSFSAMTESLGSVKSAKLIQSLRDLLLPVIDSHGGAGKSTGGDGLVASFPDPRQALLAAQAMQTTLAASKLSATPVSIRIGIAEGEVVLDKSGRPFIGAALNLAARIMDLADGGHIMVESSVLQGAGITNLHDHGLLRLRNLKEPVHVWEVIWEEGMAPGVLRGVSALPGNDNGPGD